MLLRLTGGRTIDAYPDAVWCALHDMDCVRRGLPGGAILHRAGPTRFALTLRVPFGPVSVLFEGEVAIRDMVAPERLCLDGRGHGGVAGKATGRAEIVLRPSRAGCRLTYVVEAEPSGPIALLGTPILTRLARDLVDRFADAFIGIVTRPPGPAIRPSAEVSTTSQGSA